MPYNGYRAVGKKVEELRGYLVSTREHMLCLLQQKARPASQIISVTSEEMVPFKVSCFKACQSCSANAVSVVPRYSRQEKQDKWAAEDLTTQQKTRRFIP